MEYNTQGYVLNVYDYKRIQPLQERIKEQSIEFKYFITLDYYERIEDISKVLIDNRHLKKIIRGFFKSDIRMFFFNEKHLGDPTSKFYGSFHRHILVEGIPEQAWQSPTNQMERFMLELDPEMVFASKFGSQPSEENKMELLKKVVKGLHHKKVPNGAKGKKYLNITNVDGLLSYCTKQNHKNVPYEYVIDTMNSSGLDNEWYRRNYGRYEDLLT